METSLHLWEPREATLSADLASVQEVRTPMRSMTNTYKGWDFFFFIIEILKRYSAGNHDQLLLKSYFFFILSGFYFLFFYTAISLIDTWIDCVQSKAYQQHNETMDWARLMESSGIKCSLAPMNTQKYHGTYLNKELNIWPFGLCK